MASRSLNRVELIGNLTRDPELKFTPTGTAVCTFGVATNRYWTTADGQTKEDVQYHRVVAWQKLAELCGKLLAKGKKVYAVGRLTYRTFTGKDGVQRSITEIVLDDFILFGDGKKMSTEEEASNDKAASDKARAQGGGEHEVPMPEESSAEAKISEDDIPF